MSGLRYMRREERGWTRWGKPWEVLVVRLDNGEERRFSHRHRTKRESDALAYIVSRAAECVAWRDEGFEEET